MEKDTLMNFKQNGKMLSEKSQSLMEMRERDMCEEQDK